MLAGAPARERLQAIPRRYSQVGKPFRCVQLKELPKSDPSDVAITL
jgi:hypothetical protein